MVRVVILLSIVFCFNCLQGQGDMMKLAEVKALPVTPPNAKVAYGIEASQYGELRLPKGNGPFPVVVIIHGGCWVASIADLHLMDPMASELTKQGFATWNLEYRRLGEQGGGWPGTFWDALQGLNYLSELAKTFPIDLDHVVITGHSAGGHLALWLAGFNRVPSASDLKAGGNRVAISGVVSLAGIVDLEKYLVREGNSCGSHVEELVGGLPENTGNRYQEAAPIHLIPSGIPQVLITGEKDITVPVAHVTPYFIKSQAAGDWIRQVNVANAAHFEVIAPGSLAWPSIVQAIKKLSKKKAK